MESTQTPLEKVGVVTVPGVAFGADDQIRLSFACSQAVLAEGLNRMAKSPA